MRKTWNILSLNCSCLLALDQGCPSLTWGVWQLNSDPAAGREGLDPPWVHCQPRGLPAWAPAWGRSPWCSALHTQRTLFILKASARQPDESREKEIKRFTPATQRVTGRAGKSSPTVTPVSPGETCPGSPVPLLGKGRVSSILLISTEKWEYWVKLGACSTQQIKPRGKPPH